MTRGGGRSQEGVTAPRGRLLRKYALTLAALVAVVVVLAGAVQIWFSAAEQEDALVRIQREKATAAAASIEQFIAGIEGQLGWTSHASAYPDHTSPPVTAVLVALILLGIQIALGGWTSSNYAAVACPDFPKCQNEWWPETDYKDAFVLWRGLGVNYEGGVLQHPARVAIHFTHRLGAIAATVARSRSAAASEIVTVVCCGQKGLRSKRPSTRSTTVASTSRIGGAATTASAAVFCPG